MTQDEAIRALDSEWDAPDGFFFKLRGGQYRPLDGESILATINRIELGDGQCVRRELVRLLWYLPLFVDWQKERVADAGGPIGEYERFANQLLSALEDLLGVP